MKSTGIVRRIDELGRIVIPKEIRRSLDIEEGDPMEIYVNGNQIILVKYEPSINSPRTLIRELLADPSEISDDWLERAREAVS